MADVKISELPTTGSVARTNYVETSDGTNSRRRTIAQVVGLTQQSDVSGLTTALSGKANSSHTHAQSDVTNLVSDLAGKAASSHTHTASAVTDFSEAVDDRVAALLVEGENVTITYDDGDGTLTIATAGGEGSSAWATPAVVSNPASPYTATGLTGSAVIRISGITGPKTINAPTGTFPLGRNWVLYEIGASGGPYTITLGSGITHDGIGVAPTIAVPENGKAALLLYSDDGVSWRISGDYDFAANRGAILAALGLSTLKARFEIVNPVAGTIDLLRENLTIGTIGAVLAWTDTGSLTAEVQIANKTGANDYTPTGAAAITGLSAVNVTSAPARVAASSANVMGRSGTTGRILQVALSALSGAPTRLTIEMEYALS